MGERVLDGRYALEMPIGSGGMADVYRAKDQLLERTVAVKILHRQYENDTEFIARFQREAKAAARITHPNIVNVYDVGVAEGRHYIVMEYVPGRTLKEGSGAARIGGAAYRGADCKRARTGTCSRACTLRHQAAQHPRHAGRYGEGRRFRHRARGDGIHHDL